MYISARHIIIILSIASIAMLLFIIYLLAAKNREPKILVLGSNGLLSDNIQHNNDKVNYSSIIPVTTEFYNKSLQYASDYLLGQVKFNDIYNLNMPAQGILKSVNMLNNDIKKNIITAMQFASIDAASAGKTEQRQRMVSGLENIPLWIILLRDAGMKVAPSLNLENTAFSPTFVQSAAANLSVVKSA